MIYMHMIYMTILCSCIAFLLLYCLEKILVDIYSKQLLKKFAKGTLEPCHLHTVPIYFLQL